MSTLNSINHKQVWRLAIPMILANISVSLVGIVDTAVVGHLNAIHYIGAVSIGSLIFNFLFWAFGFLRMGTTGITAQAYGARTPEQSWLAIQYSAIGALLIAIILILSQQLLLQWALYWLAPSSIVSHFTDIYFSIRIWSAPAVLINYIVLGWLIGKGASRSALMLIALINSTNILLDILLVQVLNLDVSGVALASVIAEYVGVILSAWLLKNEGYRFQRLLSSHLSFSKKSFIALHGNIFIRTLCVLFSFAFFTAQGAKQGDLILAVNAVLLHLITFMAFFLDGLANAAEVMTGQAIGQGNQHLLRRSALYTGAWSLFIAILLSLGYAAFGNEIIFMMSSIPEINRTAEQYLPWLIIAPIIAVWSYLFDGIFIGATRSREMRNTMLFSTILCYLPAWYLLIDFGNHGLWIALLVFLAARALSQAFYLPRILTLSST